MRQQTDESVDSYANKFKKLVTCVGLIDNTQMKKMFLMGLNPAYTSLVYSQNPADLDVTINSARTIEIGYNFASGKALKDFSTTTVSTPKNVVTNAEVDELTKKLEQLSINYANLMTALLAQPQQPSRRRTEQTYNDTTRRSRQNMSPITCYNCNREGHIARNCL